MLIINDNDSLVVIIAVVIIAAQVIILIGSEYGHTPQVPNQTLILPSSLLLPREDGHLKPEPQKMIARLALDHKEGEKWRKMKKILGLFTMGLSHLQ